MKRGDDFDDFDYYLLLENSLSALCIAVECISTMADNEKTECNNVFYFNSV